MTVIASAKHVLEEIGNDGCGRAKGSVLQNKGEAARDHATQGPAQVTDLVFDLKATGHSYPIMSMWGEMLGSD